MKFDNPENLFAQFIRNYSDPFSVKELKKAFSITGINFTTQELKSFLDSNPDVLQLHNGMYITKAGAFTGEIFSILPTSQEFDQGVMVPGDRCLPFLDADHAIGFYNFYINGRKIPSKSGTFDSDLAIDMFMMFGEEYAPQYIASDPANQIDMAERDFELPSCVKLTGLDLDFLKKNYHFNKGDRLLCCVNDWGKCKINVMIMHTGKNRFDKGDAGEKRLEWYRNLESYLLESFKKYGPLSTIEEQLVNVYFDHRRELCVPYCGSFEEYINHYAKNVSIGHFGVETRLWRKGEDVPAFGEWNRIELNQMEKLSDKVSFQQFLLCSVPDCILDQFVLNALYTRTQDNLVQTFIDTICQDEIKLDDSTISGIAIDFKERTERISSKYNWFRDQKLGPVRRKAVELYGPVLLLVRKIDYIGSLVADFPQQEIVILSQLYGHLVQMLEAVSGDFEIMSSELSSSSIKLQVEENAQEFEMSLDGMKWNFEDIKGPVESSLHKQELNKFTVFNKNQDAHKKITK